MASLLIAIFFDYFGRIGALSYIIFAIAVGNYIHSFQLGIQDLPLAVIFSVYIALIMCVPLLIGDSTTRDKYGKTMSFSYLLIVLGVLSGMTLMISIPIIIENKFLANTLITGTIYMACIFCLIFLLNMRETLPSKEQEWKKYLIHMYIIHNSGILLYEHTFSNEGLDTKKRDVSADLKAGGIIGVKNILKEIVRGEKEVRTIDHGDRLLILKLNSTGNVVFALVVKDESIVIRKKLDFIIEEFDKSYSQFTDDVNLGGIDMRIFNPIKILARKYFGT
jgi:energy-converting hydrogenase Eha subunit A